MKNCKVVSLLSYLTVALFAVLFFNSCEDKETYSTQFAVSCTGYSESMTNEVYLYITTRCDEVNKSEFSGVIEQKNAESLFNAFCSKLETEVKNKGFRMFSDMSANMKMTSIAKDVTIEKKISFQKNAEPKYYVQVVFTEEAPNGDTKKATIFLENQLNGLSLKKETKTVDKQTVNTYSFYKEYPTADEAEQYFGSKKESLDKMLNKIEKEWPADVVYTGKLYLNYKCVNEKTGKISNKEEFSVTHRPVTISKTWKTTSVDAPFASVLFSGAQKTDSPFFVTYGITIDRTATQYYALRLGAIMYINDGNKVKYIFEFDNATNLRLAQKDGVEISNGPVYTCQE